MSSADARSKPEQQIDGRNRTLLRRAATDWAEIRFAWTLRIAVGLVLGFLAVFLLSMVVTGWSRLAPGTVTLTDRDGLVQRDPAEAGVADVRVALLDANGDEIGETTTDADGRYSFEDMGFGEPYAVLFDPSTLPSGRALTVRALGADPLSDSDAEPASGRTQFVVLSIDAPSAVLDAGVRAGDEALRPGSLPVPGVPPAPGMDMETPPTGLLSGMVFTDVGSNGVRDAVTARVGVQQIVSSMPDPDPLLSGMQSSITGSIYIAFITLFLAVPIGIAAAVYLEEFANRDKWYNRLIELNIQNLAAVPAIIYGLLTLGFIARKTTFFGHEFGLDLGSIILAAGICLSLLVLPIVIITSREAIRAVPNSTRQGALALGATQWQTVWKQVLPAAVPGIATGTILSLARAIGEASPLVLLGGVVFVTYNVEPQQVLLDAFRPRADRAGYTVMPIQIFNWVQRPQRGFEVLSAAGSVVLVGLLLMLNSVAIVIRRRARSKS